MATVVVLIYSIVILAAALLTAGRDLAKHLRFTVGELILSYCVGLGAYAALKRPNSVLELALAGAFFLLIFYCATILLRGLGVPIIDPRAKNRPIEAVVTVVGAIAVSLGITVALGFMYGVIGDAKGFYALTSEQSRGLWCKVLFIVTIEEILFRALPYAILRKRQAITKHVLIGVAVVSTVMFSFAHSSSIGSFKWLQSLAIGGVFWLVYHRSGLICAILSHYVFNMVCIYLWR